MGKTKTSTLDRIRANIQNELQLKVIDAWSTPEDEFTVYWNPITLSDKQKIQKHARGDDQATTIYTIIFKAVDQDGEPLFTLADKVPLMTQIGSKDIELLALDMLGVGGDFDAGK